MAHVAVHRICKLEVILILILNAHISLAKYSCCSNSCYISVFGPLICLYARGFAYYYSVLLYTTVLAVASHGQRTCLLKH